MSICISAKIIHYTVYIIHYTQLYILDSEKSTRKILKRKITFYSLLFWGFFKCHKEIQTEKEMLCIFLLNYPLNLNMEDVSSSFSFVCFLRDSLQFPLVNLDALQLDLTRWSQTLINGIMTGKCMHLLIYDFVFSILKEGRKLY